MFNIKKSYLFFCFQLYTFISMIILFLIFIPLIKYYTSKNNDVGFYHAYLVR